MLNKNNERELAYVVLIDDITPIEGYDRVELAHVGGWTIVVGKSEFHAGDPAIYFEIDSKLPEVKPFTDMEFLVKKKFKIKTQKMCKSYSQGLLMSAANFGWEIQIEPLGGVRTPVIIDNNGKPHYPNDESRFLTAALGVTYAEPSDNRRKATSADKYKKMAQRHGKLFSKKPFKWLMKKTWGKKFLFIFLGRKKDKKNGWPAWIPKTDEERIENLPFLFNDKSEWIATEKIDGSSTTFAIKRGNLFHKDDFYICSRNVVFNKPDQPCFYNTNIYIEMANKYDIENKMKKLLYNYFPKCDWLIIQGETYGKGVQKRDYHMNCHNFMAFNFITSTDGRWNTVRMKNLLEKYFGIPCVPIEYENFILPNTIEELRNYVDIKTSVIDGDIREGLVFRSKDGIRSFKCVSPKYLLKYH